MTAVTRDNAARESKGLEQNLSSTYFPEANERLLLTRQLSFPFWRISS
jgi:hypothetical protein